MLRLRFILSLSLLCSACASDRTPVPSAFVEDPVLVVRHAPGFFGPPRWELSVSRDGSVQRVVHDRARTFIYREPNLSKSSLQRIIDRARSEGFFSLASRFESPVSDQPAVSIEIRDRNVHHRVDVYGPGAQQSVSEVQAFLSTWRLIVELCPPKGPSRRQGGRRYYLFEAPTLSTFALGPVLPPAA